MNREEWTKVAEQFYSKWQFSNCIGALDGKHIKIRCNDTPESAKLSVSPLLDITDINKYT